jgi:hypothetical protein
MWSRDVRIEIMYVRSNGWQRVCTQRIQLLLIWMFSSLRTSADGALVILATDATLIFLLIFP